MSLTTMLKPKTAKATEPPLSEFEIAKARWTEIDGKHKALVEREEGIKLAMSFARSAPQERTPKHIRDKAEPFMELARRRPKKLLAQLEDVLIEIEDFGPKHSDELEIWQEARRRETSTRDSATLAFSVP